MARFVRSSKYRHVFGTEFKRDKCYDGIRITKSPHESNMCSVNGKFLAVVMEAQGGGAFLVAPLTAVGRFDINYPKVCGHKKPVLDVTWNPFNDNEIASCSEDCTVKLWDIPDEGLKENLAEFKMDMAGHMHKVIHLAWHPSAANILASVGFDHKIIIWNTSTGEQAFSLEGIFSELIYSISWNYNGSLIATTSKDKKIRVIDPRKGEVVAVGDGHVGTKPSRVTFCGTSNKLFSTGFSRMSERQYAVWDVTNLSKSLTMANVDTSSGVMFPFYDEGTKMVYVAGKGDTQIRLFEIVDEPPYCHFLNMVQFKDPMRGMGCMPKRELNYMKCEVMRFFKLLNKGIVEPVSMTVPRKSDMFQEDIFPPTFDGKPALSAEEWVSGQNKDPILISFTSDGLVPMSAKESQRSKEVVFSKGGNPSASKQKQEPKVVKQWRSGSQSPESGTPFSERPLPVTLEEYRTSYQELLEENKKLREKLALLEGK